jgi:acetyl-CoA carboxylase biotin carboxyl carrier protein
MNLKELKELVEFLKQQEIAEFELERGDIKVRIKRSVPGAGAVPEAQTPAVRPLPNSTADTGTTPSAASAASVAQSPTPPSLVTEEKLYTVRSPIVGTYYEAPSPGAPPFAKVGDVVEVGQVLCIVEAMKLMNEIESDVAGEIVKMLVTNGQPIEYGQELFVIRPRV